MTTEDVIRGAQGKPVPFEFGGYTYLLRPLTRVEVRSLRELADGVTVQERIISLAVCDESGKILLEPSQVPSLPNASINALADEIAKRNWEPAGGKADSVETTA